MRRMHHRSVVSATQVRGDRVTFTGVGVALATLFDADLAVDVDATRDHAVRLVEAGMQAVIVAGSTGEASALDREERRALITAVKEAVTVPVIAGSGAPSSRQAVTLSLDALAAGADALLVLSPPGVADPLPYYPSVRAAVPDTPLLGYHYPTSAPRASPSTRCRACPSTAARTPPATPTGCWPPSRSSTGRSTPVRRPCSRWPARSAAPAPSSAWPTSSPRAASPPSPVTAPPNGPWPRPTSRWAAPSPPRQGPHGRQVGHRGAPPPPLTPVARPPRPVGGCGPITRRAGARTRDCRPVSGGGLLRPGRPRRWRGGRRRG